MSRLPLNDWVSISVFDTWFRKDGKRQNYEINRILQEIRLCNMS